MCMRFFWNHFYEGYINISQLCTELLQVSSWTPSFKSDFISINCMLLNSSVDELFSVIATVNCDFPICLSQFFFVFPIPLFNLISFLAYFMQAWTSVFLLLTVVIVVICFVHLSVFQLLFSSDAQNQRKSFSLYLHSYSSSIPVGNTTFFSELSTAIPTYGSDWEC